MLTRQEAVRDTLKVNSTRLDKLNRDQMRALASKHNLINYGKMPRRELIRQLAPVVTIEDFEK